MKYKIMRDFRLVTCPIIVKVGSNELTFPNGITLMQHEFDKRYLVQEITAEDGKIIVRLSEDKSPVSACNYAMDENVSFF